VIMSEQSGPDGMFIRPVAPRRRRNPAPAILAVLGVMGLFGGGGWFLFVHKPEGMEWVLPDGLPSMSDAKRCLQQHELPCAEADMFAYLKKYPNDANGDALLALILTEDGRHKEAIYYYRKAEGLGIATYDFYANYAKSLDAMGDADGAIAKNQLALKIVPTLVDVRGALAQELVRKGRAKEALDLLESFDRQLDSQGYPPYFAAQITQIKLKLGGDYAKEAAGSSDATLAPQPGQTLVKGEPVGGLLAVPVSLDGAPETRFMIDSGASAISISTEDARPYFKQGLIKPGDYRGTGFATLADGSRVMAQGYNLRSVRVGDREVANVIVLIHPGQGPRLLGQSFLKRFKSWSVDNGHKVLVLTN